MKKTFKTHFQGYIYPFHPLSGYEINKTIKASSNKQALYKLAEELSLKLKIPSYRLYYILKNSKSLNATIVK